MWTPRPPLATSAATAAAAQNPSAAAPTPSPPRATRVREEGELSSGADDDNELLQTRTAAASNARKCVEAGAQVPTSTFPVNGSNTLSVSNAMAHKTAGPSYKKTMRVNQGQFKPGTNRNITWQKPVSSDNLVITFSDDDSGAYSEKTKQDKVRDTKASSQGTQKTGNSMQTCITGEEASQQKNNGAKIRSPNFPAFPLSLRSTGAGNGSGSTFLRKELPLSQVTRLKPKQKDGAGAGVNSTDHRLEILRHEITARENELKGQKRSLEPVATKNAEFCNDRARLASEKKGVEANNSGESSHLDSMYYHDARPNKKVKLNQQHSYNQVHSDLVTVAPINFSSGVNNVKSSEVINHFDNVVSMNCNVDEIEHTVTTEPSGQIHQGDVQKNFPSSKIHHKGTEGADNRDTVNLRGSLAAAPFTSGQSIPVDISALVPVTSSQARQRVPPVGTSTVSNRRLHMEPGEENVGPLNYSGRKGVESQNSRLFSLLEMEELQERELEEAQEHRRKCEVEEREALRAYRRAQRALLEANERCAILRQKREISSAQVHGLIAENSSLVQSLSIQNAEEGLIMPSVVSSHVHVDSQMLQNQGGRYNLCPDEPPQQPVDKHEAQPHSRDEGLIAENSSLVQSLSIQNAGEGLTMPSVVSSHVHVDSQMLQNQGGRYNLCPDEPPQQPVDKHEAQPHSRDEGLIAENSSLVQSLSIQNAGEGLTMPSVVSSHVHVDSQMLQNQGGRYNLCPDEPPQQPVDKHEAQPHSRDLATNTTDPNFLSASNDNSVPSDYMEDYLYPASQARSECALDVENHMEETIHVSAQENRQTSGDSAQDYELLEASLRSRLVERFGKKTCMNSARGSNEEPAVGKVAGAEHDKQPAHIGFQLQEAEKNPVTTVEGTLELGSFAADYTGKASDLSNLSSGPSMGNCDAEENISSLGKLFMPLSMNGLCFPSSASQNAARHFKSAFPGFRKEFSREENDYLINDASSEATECVQDMVLDCIRENVNMLPATQTDNDMTHSGIDPFWPFCMFELRGKCNDEECQWQHAEHHSWRKSQNKKHATTSASGWIPYGPFQHILPVPAYRVGSNLIKADLNLMQSVLASSLWQYWQRGFCASFPLPLSVQRDLPSGAPFLQAGDGWIADSDSNRQLLNFRMLDSRKSKIIHGSLDVELFLESAVGAYCGKAQKPDRVKALLLLARSIEADPSTVILWVFYLHFYYEKDEGLGKDDMFSHAVQHNVYSYELWLMYINSRLRFDDRLDAYNDALSMLSQMTADTDSDLKERSASILDIFLQMIYFLCMSGNVEKAISRIFSILPTATHDNTGDKLLADVISCLTMSDRCILWISCLYVSIYRKLPEEISSQLEHQQALPHALAWPPIEPSTDNRSQIMELLNYAADKMAVDISESVKNGDPSYLTLSQFLTVNHTSCLAALEGFKSSANMLVKYMEEYPMCPQILLSSARLDRKYDACPGLKGFDELISDWPNEMQGIQYLWNQYIEHALADNIELAEKLLACWYVKYGEDRCVQSNVAVGTVEVSIETFEDPSLASAEEVGSGPSTSEDEVYRLLNLSLYQIVKKNLKEALVTVDKALKSANEDCYEHCLREHAAIHMLEKSSTADGFSLIIGYLADHRNLPTRELLSRRFCKNVKKNSLKQLIDDTIGPPSVGSSMINSVLEICFGPSLLPEENVEVKCLVDFVESVMEVLPANYRLALAVGRFVAKRYTGADPASMGTRFWAGSVLVNAIFRAVPVAPESVWLEAADLLEKLHAAATVKRFHQQATSVYPFSFKLWHAYFNSCKASGSNSDSIVESARQRGIELSLTP